MRKILIATVLACVVSTQPGVAWAATAIFGPQSWTSGMTSARYRSNPGSHVIYAGSCTVNPTIELRVDVINNPDISVGFAYPTCAGSGHALFSSTDSYTSPYRGHFMQSHTTFYGQLRDAHL